MNKEDFPSQQDYEGPVESLPVGSDSYIFEKYGMTREDLAYSLRSNPGLVDFFEGELEPIEDDTLPDILEQMENDILQEEREQDNAGSPDLRSSRHRQVEGQIAFGQTEDKTEEIEEETPEGEITHDVGAMDLRERYQTINNIMADLNSLSQDRGFLKKYDSGQTQDLLERYGPERLEEIRKSKERSSQTTPFRIRDNVLKLLGDIETIKKELLEEKNIKNSIWLNKIYYRFHSSFLI